MRCREAKALLTAQRDAALEKSAASMLQEHVSQCSECGAFQQHLRHLDALLVQKSTSCTRGGVSTIHIMRAVEQQRQLTQQLEDIRLQQQWRVARMRPVGTVLAALAFFTLACIPLLLLAITIVQTTIMVEALSFLGNVIDVLFVLAQYLQTGLTLVTRNSLLLSGVAFAVVIMMGMWLRLMRPPQEA